MPIAVTAASSYQTLGYRNGVVDGQQQQVPEERKRDERDRRHRPRGDLAADAGDLSRPQPRQPRHGALAGAPRPARLGHRPVALDLRRALAQARAAVRALGDVRADLVAAVLADDEQVGRLGHGSDRFYGPS